jgi:hypothetical protein
MSVTSVLKAIELMLVPDIAAVFAGWISTPLLWRGVAASQQNLSSAEPVREGEKPVERRAKRKSSGSFYMPFRGLNRKRRNFPNPA